MSQPTDSYTTWKVLLRVIALVKPYKSIFWLTTSMVILLAILSPLRPWLIQYTVDGPIAKGDFSGLLHFTLLMLGVLILESLFRYLFSYFSAWL